MIAHVALGVPGDVEEFFEALERAAQKATPLSALEFRSAVVVEVDHLAEIGVIPTTKWHPRDQVLIVNEAKGLSAQKGIVSAAEFVEADTGLPKGIDAVDGSDRGIRPHRESRAGQDGERAPETVTR